VRGLEVSLVERKDMKSKINSWFKPYALNPYNIDKFVWPGKPGVYVLGNVEQDQKVKVKQIRMSQHVKEDLIKNLGRFHVFMYKPLKQKLSQFNQNQQAMQFA
jgi:hypothetical protein